MRVSHRARLAFGLASGLAVMLGLVGPVSRSALSAGMTLHFNLDSPRPVTLADGQLDSTKLFLSDTLGASVRVIDVMAGEPLAGAAVDFLLFQAEGESQPPLQPKTFLTSVLVNGVTDSTGLALASFTLTPTLKPGLYTLVASGPTRPVEARDYAKETLRFSRNVELWDRSLITIHIVTDDDGLTTLTGRVTTSSGAGLAVPLAIDIGTLHRKTVRSDPDGTFTYQVTNLSAKNHAFRVRFGGVKYIEGSVADLTHNPALRYWDVHLSSVKRDLFLSRGGGGLEGKFREKVEARLTVRVTVRVDGELWPPRVPLSLCLVDSHGEGDPVVVVSELPVEDQHVLSTMFDVPREAGVHHISAAVVDEADRPDRARSNVLEFVVWRPTALTLVSRAETPPGELEGAITSLGEPVPDAAWTLTRSGEPVASGRTGPEGLFQVSGPFQPGEYRATFSPDPGTFYLQAASNVVRLGLFPWATVCKVVLVLAALSFLVVRRVRNRVRGGVAPARRRTGLAIPEVADDSGVTPGESPASASLGSDPATLAPRARILYAYEAMTMPALAVVAKPDPTWGEWAFWRRVSRAFPEGSQPMAGLVSIYLEARYSLHEITESQAQRAVELARYLVALAAAVEAPSGSPRTAPVGATPVTTDGKGAMGT